jgi:hypothetical protein
MPVQLSAPEFAVCILPHLVIGAITMSPIHKRLGCYFSMTPTNVTDDHLFTFVQQLHGHSLISASRVLKARLHVRGILREHSLLELFRHSI